ncbi:MAG: acyltransferase domain-containing protein, partial [bacterium]|nr:acyltransferase domain-containing protein [bacterium]
GSEIAVIGLAGRFPGAGSIEAFWRNLRDGLESITFFSDQELIARGVDPALVSDPYYVKARGALDDVDLFAADFFGFHPREARITDPQHRLFLECAWEALERAACDPRRYPGRIGVFAGVGGNQYQHHLLSNPELSESLDPLQVRLGTEKDFLASRVAYKLNLKGPAVVVQTACSTSLVAVHLACESLLRGKSDIALAGGAAIDPEDRIGYRYQEGGILSPDGHCRAFDANARGTVGGSGVGIVVLKRLADALADGDHIHALIKGSAINNDGSVKVGYTAPGVDGQTAVVREAQQAAGVAPETIGYVEAHGTGTQLGDPVEVKALRQAFGACGGARGFCALGSVKTNIGHLDAAAGVAGLIKTALALEHRRIPPSLHFTEPNPEIDFHSSPFYIATRLAEWPRPEVPLRAGVSSFGIGGTNAHVVLEEAPPREPSGPSRPWQLVLLSAKTDSALENATDRLAAHLHAHPELDPADVAYTLQVGRRAFERRRLVVAREAAEAAAALEERDPERVLSGAPGAEERPLVFMFPGQGAQHAGMGRELYEAEPAYRAELDRCCELLEPHLGIDLREVISLGSGTHGRTRRSAPTDLDQTAITQPALFAVEYALARVWMEWGLRPTALIGHSIGEYVAACLAGVFSLEDALELVALRGRLMEAQPPGSMLGVALSEEEIAPRLGDGLSLAAVNAPRRSVVSGPDAAIEALRRELSAEGVSARRLQTSHAFHSAAMEPAVEPLVERFRSLELKAPRIPYLSNVTGTWITAEQATDPGYWGRQLRGTVRFGDGIGELSTDARVLLEVGPGETLSSLARKHPARSPQGLVFSSLRRGSETRSLLTTLGRLWLAGVEVDWSAFSAREDRRRVPLPTYPFERRSYWIESRPRLETASLPLPGSPPAAGEEPVRWLVVLGGESLGQDLAARLGEEGQEVVTVSPGKAFHRHGRHAFTLDPESREHRGRLLRELLGKAETLHQRPQLERPYQAPRDEVERAISRLLEELLGIAEVGVDDDFFELGGDSLLATQVVSRLRDAFGVEIPLEDFLEGRTVAGLARRIGPPEPVAHTPIRRLDDHERDAVPLSFAQQRLWFLAQLEPEAAIYNLPLTLRLEGPLHLAALEAAVHEIVRRHQALRTRFAAHSNGEPYQVICAPPRLALPVVNLAALRSGEPELRRLAREDARRPFGLARAPLVRATLLRAHHNDHLLLLNMHHAASDGWSMGVFSRELEVLYEAFSTGRSGSPLPELEIQYADFAAWQRQWLQGDALEAQLAYWRDQLAGISGTLELATDRPRPLVPAYRGALYHATLPRPLTESLKALSRRRGNTLFMTLLAAFKALLHRTTGQDDLCVGSPVANRNRSEIEPLI